MFICSFKQKETKFNIHVLSETRLSGCTLWMFEHRNLPTASGKQSVNFRHVYTGKTMEKQHSGMQRMICVNDF